MKKTIKLIFTTAIIIALSSFVPSNKFSGTSFKIVKHLNVPGITKINTRIPFYQRFYRKNVCEGVSTPIVIGNSSTGSRNAGISYSEPFQLILPSSVPIDVLMLVIKYSWLKDNDDPANKLIELTITPMYEATDDSGNPLPASIANQIIMDMQTSDGLVIGSSQNPQIMDPVKAFTLHFYGAFPTTGGGYFEKYFDINCSWEDYSGEFNEQLNW